MKRGSTYIDWQVSEIRWGVVEEERRPGVEAWAHQLLKKQVEKRDRMSTKIQGEQVKDDFMKRKCNHPAPGRKQVAPPRRRSKESLRKGQFSKVWAGLREPKYDSKTPMTSDNGILSRDGPKVTRRGSFCENLGKPKPCLGGRYPGN